MSYDVTINGEWFNYTSNMHQFFKDFDVYPPEWQGKTFKSVAAEIRFALESIERNDLSSLKAEYDAPNGWGDVETAIDWLKRIAAAGEKRVSRYVEVSW